MKNTKKLFIAFLLSLMLFSTMQQPLSTPQTPPPSTSGEPGGDNGAVG